MKNSHTSYERYKAKLHAIFDGRAPLPDHLKESCNTEQSPLEAVEETLIENNSPPKASSVKTQRRLSPSGNPKALFIEALRRASTPDEMKRAVAAIGEAKLDLPHDEDLLSKVLTYPDESIVLDVLTRLEEVLEKGPAKNPRLLISRLDNAAFECRPGPIMERILKIKNRLKS